MKYKKMLFFATPQNKIVIRLMSEQDPRYWRFKSDIWSTEDKQPNSRLVIRLHVALSLVNICFIKPSLTFVCYFGLTAVIRIDLDSAGRQLNQTWQMWGRQCRCFLNQAGVIHPLMNPSWSSLIDSGLLLRLFFFSCSPCGTEGKNSWLTVVQKVSSKPCI